MITPSRSLLLFAASALACGLTACDSDSKPEAGESASASNPIEAVVQNYATIVHAVYQDCVSTAVALEEAVDQLVADPTEETLAEAREAWLAARVPYGQSEVFRFYDGPIDDADGPEGLLNAWPMDESYIDYVEGNPDAGIINATDRYASIEVPVLVDLNEKAGETNISTGYHAVEFLLWGQDLSADGPGERPHTDYSSAPNAERRGQYLQVVTGLIVEHLKGLEKEWAPDQADNYRAAFLALPPEKALQKILTGMGMLSGFELAGERMMVPLASRAQEDEHSCFSDNTHVDIIENARGIQNIVEGRYDAVDGEVIGDGKGIAWLLEEGAPDLAASLREAASLVVANAEAMPTPFDQAILAADGAPERQAVELVVENLRTQAGLLVEAGETYDLVINIEE